MNYLEFIKQLTFSCVRCLCLWWPLCLEFSYSSSADWLIFFFKTQLKVRPLMEWILYSPTSPNCATCRLDALYSLQSIGLSLHLLHCIMGLPPVPESTLKRTSLYLQCLVCTNTSKTPNYHLSQIMSSLRARTLALLPLISWHSSNHCNICTMPWLL